MKTLTLQRSVVPKPVAEVFPFFAKAANLTKITDHVRYAVWGGSLIERIFVRPDLKRIFDGRQLRMSELFDSRPLLPVG